MPNQIPKLESITGKELIQLPIEPLEFTIGEILPQGIFILSGSPKVGKSWLALDMCLVVATGGTLWEYPSAQGDALYLALEDKQTRLQDRLKKILDDDGLADISNLHFVTKSAKLGEGLREQLTEFLDTHPNTKLVVIDTMQYIRNTGEFTGTYSGDYHDMDALREIISDRKLTLLLVTHPSKQDHKDPVKKVTGSTGLVGAADGVFIIEKESRNGNAAYLHIANRDTENHLLKLRFDKASCRWQFISEVSDGNDYGDNDDYLFTMLDCLLDQYSSWSGTATQLCGELRQLDSDFSFTPTVITKALKMGLDKLALQYGIMCSFTRNKSARTIDLGRSTKNQNCKNVA